MNHTESGAIAAGSPNSAARFAAEAEHAMENQYQLLLLTEEGRALLWRFASSIGCDFNAMDNLEAANWMQAESKTLFSFLCGVVFMFRKI